MKILFKVATNLLSQDDQFLICSIKLFLTIVYFKEVTKRSNLLRVEFVASVVANLPPVSITPAVNANLRKDVAAGDNDTSG
jgi:hypothetical protein